MNFEIWRLNFFSMKRKHNSKLIIYNCACATNLKFVTHNFLPLVKGTSSFAIHLHQLSWLQALSQWRIKFWLGFYRFIAQSILLLLVIVQRKRLGLWKHVFIITKEVSCIDANGIVMLWDFFLVFLHCIIKFNFYICTR